MKYLIALIFTLSIITAQGQRIRDLVNQATADSTAYLVIDKAGWATYKKIRADVFLTTATDELSDYIDSIKTATGLTPILYVPFDSSNYIQTADFTYRGYTQNMNNSIYILDEVLDSVNEALRVLKDTSTYRILNVTNELGVKFAGSQYKTAGNKFLMNGVSGTANSNAFMAMFDTANDVRHLITVDTSKIAMRFNQTIAGSGDFSRYNMQDTGIVLQHKISSINNYVSLTDLGFRVWSKGVKTFWVDSAGFTYSKNIVHGFGGFQDSATSLAITQNAWRQMTNATKTLFNWPELDGITETGDTLTLPVAGDYSGVWTITFSGTNGNEYEFRVYNVTTGAQVGYYQGGTAVSSSLTCVTLPFYVSMAAANSEIVFQCTNISAGNAIVPKHSQINIRLEHTH